MRDNPILRPRKGQEDRFFELYRLIESVSTGMGWGGMTDLMVMLGVEKSCGIRGNKRRRKKKMKRLLRLALFQSLMDSGEWVSESDGVEMAVRTETEPADGPAYRVEFKTKETS